MFQTGKTAQVEREMSLYSIGISECRWTGNGCVTTSLGNTIIYSGRNDNDHREGVAIIMSKAAKKSMIEWTPMSERLIAARFKSRYTSCQLYNVTPQPMMLRKRQRTRYTNIDIR